MFSHFLGDSDGLNASKCKNILLFPPVKCKIYPMKHC